MGRKLDLSGLSDNEAEHVLQVVQRDMRLRKTEEARLSELRQELDEEGSRCLLLSRQSCFNQRCCIRCCSPFTFLLNPKRQCRDCHYNVCKACRVYNKQERAWLCTACQKSRFLKTQSLEWFYNNVKKRFKRFGSAKVLKTLYRKHLVEHTALSELTEGSAYEDSVCNEGSVCGSDSAFYRQTEEHSMAETLSVALRVAEEAIDEAISKAEFDTSSQETQNEAHYLREHRGELIEELAKSIVQKIISRRKTLAEMRAEYDQDWPLEHNTDPHQSTCDRASNSIKHQPSLWRSHSAFSLLDNDPPGLIQDSPQTLKKEGGGSAMSSSKSVDRLDNAGVSSVLKSPDGNWIALQSAQLSRPSLLTKRKSLVYSALERESAVVSAYEGMGSDNESKPEPDSSWGAALQEIHKKMTDSNLNPPDTCDGTPSSGMDCLGSREDLMTDWEPHKPLLALLKRSMSSEIWQPSTSSRSSSVDINCNMDGAEEEEEREVDAEQKVRGVRRSRRRRSNRESAASSVQDCSIKNNQSGSASDAVAPDTIASRAYTPDPFELDSKITGHEANQMDQELTIKLQQLTGCVSDSSTREEEVDRVTDNESDVQMDVKRQGSEDRDEEDGQLWRMEVDLDEGRTEDEEKEEDIEDEEVKDRLHRLVAQARLTYFAPTDDEVDKVGLSERKWEGDKDKDREGEGNEEQKDEKIGSLPYKICQLEKEVRASEFSSTEDELDGLGVMEEETGEDEGAGENEELAVKVCRLANQVKATEFSSTEDELDRAGREGEEAMDEEALWKSQAEKAIQAAQLRDLSCLVSASQFSSTEDQLDGVDGENEGAIEGGFGEEEEATGKNRERRESFADLDVRMFDLRDETEEKQKESSDGKLTTETTLENQTENKTKVKVKKDCVEERVMEVTEDERMVTGQVWEGKVLKECKEAKDADGRQVEEGHLKAAHETRVQQENQPEAKWPDKRRGGERQHDVDESKESQEEWESAAESIEEDEEFDRIISSMLMLTLEDMQGGLINEVDGKMKREPEELETDVKTGRGSDFQDHSVNTQSTNASDETGSSTESQSRGENVIQESAGEERPGQSGTEQDEEIPRKEERGHAVDGNKNEETEKDTGPQDKRNVAEEVWTIKETRDAQHAARETEDDKEEGGGDAAEGGCETKAMGERFEGTNRGPADHSEQSSTPLHEGPLSPERNQIGSEMELYETLEFMSALLEQRHSAVSLRSITTEVLRVLNATEELLQDVEGDPRLPTTSLPPDTDPKKLDQQFSRLEENVYVAAGTVYTLEAELGDLEECARGISSATSDMELSFLEEQVASAAAKVQHSELQICDISARIAALKSAGLDVDTQSRITKTRTVPVMPVTLNSSRQLRRRLPAPPVKEDKET